MKGGGGGGERRMEGEGEGGGGERRREEGEEENGSVSMYQAIYLLSMRRTSTVKNTNIFTFSAYLMSSFLRATSLSCSAASRRTHACVQEDDAYKCNSNVS